MATVAKLFKRPVDVEKAVSELRGMGLSPKIIEKPDESELSSMNLSEQALNYFKTGLTIGGKIVAVEVDDSKANETNRILISIGFNKLTDRPPQWVTSPGFTRAVRMTATNPIDAKMSGDFRKY